jgi:nitrogen fixation/metabolism regulation signal transduction histidine kinase
MARVFEPYVTTKSKGTGLGLAIVKKIVDEHHGSIDITNRQPAGAQVCIRLPLAPPAGNPAGA